MCFERRHQAEAIPIRDASTSFSTAHARSNHSALRRDFCEAEERTAASSTCDDRVGVLPLQLPGSREECSTPTDANDSTHGREAWSQQECSCLGRICKPTRGVDDVPIAATS